MKNAAIDRTVGKIVITSDSERVPTKKKKKKKDMHQRYLLFTF